MFPMFCYSVARMFSTFVAVMLLGVTVQLLGCSEVHFPKASLANYGHKFH